MLQQFEAELSNNLVTVNDQNLPDYYEKAALLLTIEDIHKLLENQETLLKELDFITPLNASNEKLKDTLITGSDKPTNKLPVRDLSEKLENIGEVIGELKQGNLASFERLSLLGKEILLSELDWSSLKNTTQVRLLEIISRVGNWLSLSIRNCEVLTNNEFKFLLKNSPRLERLLLSNCPGITHDIFAGLAKSGNNNLKVIELENLSKLQFIGSRSGRVYSQVSWVFPELETLVITDCENLQEINIEAKYLQILSIKKLKILNFLRTQSQFLKILRLINCNHLPYFEWMKIIDTEYSHQINVIECEHIEKIYGALIKICPILIGIDWAKFDLTKNDKNNLITVLNRNVKEYTHTTSISRKNLYKAIQQLLIKIGEKRKHTISLPTLLRAMKSNNKEIRKYKLEILGNIGKADEGVIAVISNTVMDIDSSVRKKAVEALVKIGRVDDRIIAVLNAKLGDNNPEVSQSAAEDLIKLGKVDDRVNAVLNENLSSTYPGIKQRAAEAIGMLGRADDKAITALRENIDDEDLEVSLRAAEALVKIGKADEKAIAPLSKSLVSWCPDIRRRGAEALGAIGIANEEIVNKLIMTTVDSDSFVSVAAMEALVKMAKADGKVIKTLNKNLSSLRRDIKQKVAETLTAISEANYGVLIKKIDEKDPVVYQVTEPLFVLGKVDEKVLNKLSEYDGIVIQRTAETFVIGGTDEDVAAAFKILIQMVGKQNENENVYKLMNIFIKAINSIIKNMINDFKLTIDQSIVVEGSNNTGGSVKNCSQHRFFRHNSSHANQQTPEQLPLLALEGATLESKYPG